MLKFRVGLLFALLVLSGCDHHKKADQAQAEAGSAAVVQNDSDLTGQPPATTTTTTVAVSAPTNDVAAATPPSSSAPQPAAPPADANSITQPSPSETSTPAITSAVSPGDSSSAPPPSAAAPSSGSDSDAPRLSMNTANPVAATNPAPSPDNPAAQDQVVVLETSFGRIIIELDDFAAPKTCENFRKLVSQGFYDHTTFHRVIPNFIIQGGDPNSRSDDRDSYGKGDPGYTLPAEIKLKHDLGAVAMARLPDSVNPQRESNGSQFYICVTPCPSLDDQYTVFGHVIKGIDVAQIIASQPRDRRDNPLGRIPMEAHLESRDQALTEGSATNP